MDNPDPNVCLGSPHQMKRRKAKLEILFKVIAHSSKLQFINVDKYWAEGFCLLFAVCLMVSAKTINFLQNLYFKSDGYIIRKT